MVTASRRQGAPGWPIDETSVMLERIISGGESGANQAAWRAARAFGVASGGWMHKGFLTDDGCRPEFAEQFAAADLPTDAEPARAEQNVWNSDATLWFGATTTSVAHATVQACQKFARPCLPVYPEAAFEPSHVATWIVENRVRTLNVAGNCENDEPGIGDHVEQFLGEVLRQLGHERA
jgi:hypothetical protein